MPQIASALLRSGPSANVVEMMDRAVGVMIAAPTPWIARAAISAPGDQASPHSSEASVKSSEPDHEQPAAAEQVGGTAAQQEQTGEGERVGADHPLQPLLGEVESRLDRGQRDDHDIGVEDDHEERAAEQRERPPAAWIRE